QETLDQESPKTGDRQWLIMTAEFGNWNYLSLLVTLKDALSNTWEPNQKQPLTNIPLATVIENESLAAIFPFEIKELTETLLFSRATLEEKSIMAMYTDAKIDGQFIKLILDSGSTGSIIIRQLIDQLGHRVNRAASIKIITADGATKTPIAPLIELKKEKEKPTWEVYQVSWADKDNHNKLPPILSWNNKGKGKQTEELTWNLD
ncbi:hypothetical protein G9A89_009571, partial [Geosiphon pyriformis]